MSIGVESKTLMLGKFPNIFALSPTRPNRWAFVFFALAVLGCVGLFVATEEWLLLGLPFGLLVLWVAILDFRKLYYLLFLSIPFSMEMELPGGLGTDLPTEPLMWLLLLTSTAYFLRHWKDIQLDFVKHPITVLLLLHLGWTFATCISSQDGVVSLKFFLAKIWYVVVLYFLAGYLIRKEKDLSLLIWCVSVSLMLSIFYTSYNHAQFGFSFESSNNVGLPFYRNHVVYACLPAIFLPYLFYTRKSISQKGKRRFFLAFVAFCCLFAINFAFTRAAYVALAAAVGLYFIIRKGWMKQTLLLASVVAVLFVGYITSRDNYLYYAPDFERTITHKRFESLLEATTKLEDISTMERVYRWVAAAYMIEEKPLVGWGPGTFYFYYKDHTVSSFKTYVSGNPERSGIHCYYLMVTVEQGILGGLIFLALVFVVLLYAEKLYHKNSNEEHRRMVLAAGLSFFMICLLMLMNDFVETDKMGAFFFLSMAILVRRDLKG